MQQVFDGHNDILHRLAAHAALGIDPVNEFLNGLETAGSTLSERGHIDRLRAHAGGLIGGLTAIFIPSGHLEFAAPDESGAYATPLAAPLDRRNSLDTALAILAIALRIEQAGGWKICRTSSDVQDAVAQGVFASVLHMEGCEALDSDLLALETFYAAGLRSLGPVWSRHNIFGHGVPFAYPMHPDTAPGLTQAGFRLIRECNRLGILVDLAHMTEQGFWDVASTSDQPLVVSHSNAHAITPVARNLTDRQLDAVRERNGVVGLNFAVGMLRPDGQENAETPVSAMIRHIDYLVERMGLDCVAIGSDFDGATIPNAIGDAAGLPMLVSAIREAGYDQDETDRICRRNWLRVLSQAWKEPH